jgi:hypothetical protein
VQRLPFKNKEAMREFRKRRAQRRSHQGRELEFEVERILQKMQDEGLIVAFERFRPHSPEDREGCDFEATLRVGTDERSERFGVTISQRSWTASRLKHPDIPQFRFPPGTNESTIRKRILSLFGK